MASIRRRRQRNGGVAYQADYRDGTGARRHRQFATKKEADAFLLTVRGQVRDGIHVAASQSISVADAAKLWLERGKAEQLEASTLASYKQHVDLHIVPLIGATKLSTLTAVSVQAFADDLAKTRSRAMVRKVLRSLSGIFTEAQRRGKVAHNPLRAVRFRTPKRDNKRPEMPTKAELKAILKATPEKHRPFIFAATFTGMRASELRGLSWANVDLDAAILHVRQRADRFNQIGPPKSEAGRRDIPLAPAVVKELREWMKACPKGELDLVFPNGAGHVESHANLLNRVFWPIQVAAGVVNMVRGKDHEGRAIQVPEAKYSLHALRHAAAALWIDRGAKAKRIQVLMGHASIQQTFDVYGYLLEADDSDQAAVKAIEDQLLAD